MKRLMVAVAVAGAMAFGAYADSSRSITVTAYNRGTDGVVESVDLAFGECADDYVGDLYVAYGYTAGDDLTPTNGWDHYEKLSDAITAEVKSYHYAMPEGWSESFYHLKFFLFVQNKGYETVKDYYVQSGLVKMFDGVDNAGTGTHDATATQWKNLVDGEMYDWKVTSGTAPAFDGENALQFNSAQTGFIFAPNGLGQIWTLQVVLGGAVSTFVDGPGDSLWCNGGGVKFGWRGGPTRPAPVNWSKTSDPLTIVSADTWIGVHTPGANGGWAKTENISIGSYSSTAELCIGGGIYDGDSANSGMKIYAVRVYDRVLSDAEISANDIVDQARFYGRGTVPPLGESAYVLSGTSDLIKRDAYVTLSLDQIDEPTEIDISARLTLGGFDLGARAFAIYAVFGDGTEQQVATDVKLGDSVRVKVEELVPDAAYAVRFYAKDVTLSSPMTQEKTFVTLKPVLHPAKALEGGRAINIAGYKTKKGFITGVDLAFGACPDDWTGDLYVAYGQRSGFDLARAEWAHFEKLNEAPVTAADKTFHYDMPEGWRESIWSARFFFETHTTGFVNASSYYVQDGLIAMFDGIDNVGTGVHDPNATAWVDLMGNGYDISVWPYLGTQLNGWTENSLAAKVCQCVPLAKSCEDYVTIEIFLKHDGKYGGAFYAGSRAKGKIVVTNNDTIEFYNSASDSVYFLGDRERAHAAAVYSPDATKPIVYTKGALATVRGGDNWGNLRASTTCLGMAYDDRFSYSGEWYLVRLYDRALTAEEIAQNYRVDCLRYGYGDAEGELEAIPADRRVLSSSSETIYAGKRMSGMMVIIW